MHPHVHFGEFTLPGSLKFLDLGFGVYHYFRKLWAMLDSDIPSGPLSFLFFLVSGHTQVLSFVHDPHSEVPALETSSSEKQ